MTIIVFLIDTSASMNQKTYLGPSFLDLAKGAVDAFLKFRVRDPSARGADRYMLLTFEDPPKHIKAGWKENQMVFMQELKNIKAAGVTSMGNALSNALHLLNVNRLQSGIDNFGGGRFPHWLEPAVIIVITDGGPLLSSSGAVKQTIEISPSPLPGSELVTEPFRWDQRIFALVLRLPGHPPKNLASSGNSLVSQDNSPVDMICEASGGRSYCITTQKMLNQCLESLVQKIQSGVVVCFEKYGPDPVQFTSEEKAKPLENGFVHQNSKLGVINNSNHVNHVDTIEQPRSPSPHSSDPSWSKTRRMIYVSRGYGSRSYNPSHWTIPEAFWPDPNMTTLPPRPAHPIIKFKCEAQEPIFPQDLPFDKYELEPSPLTQYILERKQPNICWYVYVADSSGKYGDLGAPFGYLKASTTLTNVNLVVLPYNFPVLIPLLDELKLSKGKPSSQWRAKFDKYLKVLPLYYIPALKAALQKINLVHILPDATEKHLSFSIQSHLCKIKQKARYEMERLCQSVGQAQAVVEGIKVVPRPLSSSSLKGQQLKIDLNEFNGFQVHTVPPNTYSNMSVQLQMTAKFRNPFDIDRQQLLDQITKMRINLKQTLSEKSVQHLTGAKYGAKLRLQEAEELHQLPVGMMGNYQDYLRLMPAPLRELDATPVRLHAFGNPFKVDKRMLVDEADIDNLVGSASSTGAVGGMSSPKSHPRKAPGAAGNDARSQTPNSPMSRKRKAGPLSKDFRYRRIRRRYCDSMDDAASSSSSISNFDRTSVSMDSSDNSDSCSVTSFSDFEDDEFVGNLRTEATASSSLIIDEDLSEQEDSNKIASNVYSDDQKPSTSTKSFSEHPVTIPVATDTRQQAFEHSITAEEWSSWKRQISSLVRKPTRDFRVLFSTIESLSASAHKFLYSWALNEATRFRRAQLCEQLRLKVLSLNNPLHPKR